MRTNNNEKFTNLKRRKYYILGGIVAACAVVVGAVFMFRGSDNKPITKPDDDNVIDIDISDNTPLNGLSVSLSEYGAVGDGVTDDTNAIKEALAAAQGSALMVPEGRYLVSSVIDIPSNITIMGQGESSVFIAADGFGVGKDFFRARTKQNITIDGVCFDGNSGVNSRDKGHSDKDGIHMMDLWDCTNVSIKNCVFQNNVYCAVRIVGNSNELGFIGNKFLQVDCGIIMLGSGNLDGLTVKDNYFDGHRNSEPVSLYGKGTVRNVTIDSNKMLNKTCGVGVFVGNGGKYENVSITNNYMSQNAVGISCSNVTNLTIKGNTIEDTISGIGIKIASCEGTDVSDNTVANTWQNGLYVKDCSDADIYNNVVSKCGMINKDFFAMDIRGECVDVKVYSNTFEKTEETQANCTIVCRSTGDVTINDNEFEDAKKIWLGKESSGVHVYGQDITVRNDSKNNTVE